MHKRISVTTLVNMPWHLRIAAAVVGASVRPVRLTPEAFGGVPMSELIGGWSFTETAYLALLARRPDEADRFAFTVLLGLTASNGPGTISAQGAKGAVSADGPEVRFAEWSYLDGVHGAETISTLVLAPGRHRLPDGSEWEVGTLELSGTDTWTSTSFGAPFDAPPALFLTVLAIYSRVFADWLEVEPPPGQPGGG